MESSRYTVSNTPSPVRPRCNRSSTTAVCAYVPAFRSRWPPLASSRRVTSESACETKSKFKCNSRLLPPVVVKDGADRTPRKKRPGADIPRARQIERVEYFLFEKPLLKG